MLCRKIVTGCENINNPEQRWHLWHHLIPDFPTILSLTLCFLLSFFFFFLSLCPSPLPRSKCIKGCHLFSTTFRHRKSVLCRQEGAYKTLTYRKYSWTIDLLLHARKSLIHWQKPTQKKTIGLAFLQVQLQFLKNPKKILNLQLGNWVYFNDNYSWMILNEYIIIISTWCSTKAAH